MTDSIEEHLRLYLTQSQICRNVGAICQQNSDALKLVQDSSNGQPLTDSSKLNTCIWMLVLPKPRGQI